MRHHKLSADDATAKLPTFGPPPAFVMLQRVVASRGRWNARRTFGRGAAEEAMAVALHSIVSARHRHSWRMPSNARRRSTHPTRWRRRSTHRFSIEITFALSLLLGGAATAVAMNARELFWLGWFSAVPLFAAVRWLRPGWACAAGGLWGSALLACHAILTGTPFGPGVGPATAVLVGPALFGLLLGAYRRWNGFDPLTLAVGWQGVEVLAAAAGLERGILAGTQNEIVLTGLGGRFFGYLIVALVIANVGALLTGPFDDRHAEFDSVVRRWLQTCHDLRWLRDGHILRRLEDSLLQTSRAPPSVLGISMPEVDLMTIRHVASRQMAKREIGANHV